MECGNVVSELETPAASLTTAPSSSITDEQTPRSRRVARDIPPLTTTSITSTSSHSPKAPLSPPIPVRSPLRPQARSISTQSTSTTGTAIDPVDLGPTIITSMPTSPSTVTSTTFRTSTSTTSTLTLDYPKTPLTPIEDAIPSPSDDIFDLAHTQPKLVQPLAQMMMHDRHNSLPSLNGLVDQVQEDYGIDEEMENETAPLHVMPTPTSQELAPTARLAKSAST